MGWQKYHWLKKFRYCLPSFLIHTQGVSEQYLFGISCRWYPTAVPSEFVQLGARVRTALDFGGNHQISASILTVKAAFNSIMVGFVWDRYHGLPKPANAFEFSAGYILGR